jgi:hypothetical protein
VDYRCSGDSSQSGRVSVAGDNTTNTSGTAGTFQDLGNGSYKLTMPVHTYTHTSSGGSEVNLYADGTIYATASIPYVLLGNGQPDYATRAIGTYGPVNITDPNARVTDGGASNLTSMTVTLTNRPDDTQEKLNVDLSGTGLQGSYNSSTGVLAITGTASTAVYTSVLEKLTYQDDSQFPSTQNRIITVVTTDTNNNGSVVRTSTVSVVVPAAYLDVSGFPSPITAGTPGTITVTARDLNGNVATGYAGTIHFTSSDPQFVRPADYTFTTGDSGVHSFSVTLKTAGYQDIAATDTIRGNITGGQYGIVVNPAATSRLLVNGFPSPINAGTLGAVALTAQDAYGNTTPAYTGTVHLTSSDPMAGLDPDYTFSAGDSGVTQMGAILYTAGTQSITATDKNNSNITGTQSGIVVTPLAASYLDVSGFPSPITAGTEGTVTVKAKDVFGNTATSYTGKIHFTSSDTKAALPGDYTFVAGDNGVHTFNATLKTAGVHSITATDTSSGSITGSQDGIIVNPAMTSRFLVNGFPSPVTAGTWGAVTITALDAYDNTTPAYTGTVHLTSSDPLADLDPDYTFTASDAGVTQMGAVLYTAGTQSLTVTDKYNSSITGTQSGIVVNPAAATAFEVIAPPDSLSGAPFDVTIIAVDPYGNTDTNYRGTVTWTTTDGDPNVVLPPDHTFQASDAGMVTFPNGVTLITPGDQTITASDTVNGTITGSATVTVTNGPGPNVARDLVPPSQPASAALPAQQLLLSVANFSRDDVWLDVPASTSPINDAAFVQHDSNSDPADAVLANDLALALLN